MQASLQPESAAPMVASTELSLAPPPPLRNYRAGARGALVRMLPQRARQSPLRAKAGHCKTAMAAVPRHLMLGAPATAHLPCPRDVPILPRPGLQHSSRSCLEDTVQVWGRVLPQEPGALAPTTCARPSRLVCDWSSSLASPRVAGAFGAVLASAQMMRADLWAASRDGLDEEESCSTRLEAVVGTPKLVLDSVIFLDGWYRLGKIWPAALLADTISLSLSTGTCTSHILVV